jgi:hypothetical protein
MATVYAAHDSILGRLVAIKVFAGDLDIPDARARFVREARSAAALAHPHIVAVHDFGDHESQPYIVMEYIKGETLAELIRRKAPVPQADKLRWIEELASAAGYAHGMSVIHRDIKPANLMIDRSGRLKVLDFGIARMLGTVSHTRDAIGTPGYMAPEQILGDQVDGRADLFAIGVVFYELLSYTEAFPGDTSPAITHRILHNEPAPLLHLLPDLDPDVQRIIERALKKNVNDRFPDAESFGQAVSRVRRRIEADVAPVAPTVLMIRDTPPPARRTSTPAPGRRPATDAVGVVTPPPTDRDAIARRRAAQLEAALAQGRTLLAAGDLEIALEFCQQALTIDEQHVGALELEQQISAALAEPDVVDEPSAAFAYAPTVLAPPREARVPQPAPLPAPPAPAEIPPARQTTPPKAPPKAQRPPGPSLLTRVRTAAADGARRSALAASAITARLRASAPVIRTRAHALVPTWRPALPSTRRQQLIWGGVVAGLLLAVAAALVVVRLTAVPPAGTLVIDAAPWGTVAAIETPKGQRLPLPSPASTPLSLSVPSGTYQVTLTGPPPESQTQRITVRVDPNGPSVAPLVRFHAMTPEDYFDQYLTAPAATTQPAPAGVNP